MVTLTGLYFLSESFDVLTVLNVTDRKLFTVIAFTIGLPQSTVAQLKVKSMGLRSITLKFKLHLSASLTYIVFDCALFYIIAVSAQIALVGFQSVCLSSCPFVFPALPFRICLFCIFPVVRTSVLCV